MGYYEVYELQHY